MIEIFHNSTSFLGFEHWTCGVKKHSTIIMDEALSVKIDVQPVLYVLDGSIDRLPLKNAEQYLTYGAVFYIGNMSHPAALICNLHDFYMLGNFPAYYRETNNMNASSYPYMASLHSVKHDIDFSDIEKSFLIYIQRIGQKWKNVS